MRTYLSLVVASCLVVAACGKSESKPQGATPAAAPTADKPSGGDIQLAHPRPVTSGPVTAPSPQPTDSSKGLCQVNVEGDIQATGTSGGGAQAVGTDYWMTPEELDKAVEMMANMLVKDKDKAKAEIEKAKNNDPKIMLLLINCYSDKVHLTLTPGNGSKYKDVPFGPGKYPIRTNAKAGEFGIMMSIDHSFYNPDKDGTIDITKFDASGISATFEFAATGTDRETKQGKKITVKGKFDFKCSTQSKACKPS